ncbi:MAG TPA: DHA2 family efflux MFS transporter permease subunit [Polyangia bacterium]|nr:DHA2 family efflux MFS transporter permease subunit [Polyangia bacterium]
MSAAGPGAAAPARPAYFATGWTNGHNPWVIALVVTMATFMEVLDTSIANVSLPHIAGNLSVSQDEGTWVLTSYLVSNAVILPISGWIASKVGRKRFYMTCVMLFTGSSFLCGIAPSLGTLIFFRVLQGLGGGGLGPSEQAILADTFPPAKRGMAFAVYGMAVVLAPAIGPTLGGFITDHFNWRWIFFINVPVGLLSLTLTQRVVSDPPHMVAAKEKTGGIDYIGLSLIAVGLGALEIVLDKGQEDEWFASPFILGASVIAAIALISFVVWESKQEHPVVDVKMFKNRTFAAANVMMLTLGIALFGSTVLLPQYLQVLMGYTAQQSGMALSPGGFVVIALLPFVGFLVSRVDSRYMIAFGFMMLSASLFYMTRHLYEGIDFRTAIQLRVIQSIGLPFLFIPINTLVYAGVAPEKNNAVSGIVNLSRNMGGDIGIAAVTTLIARRSQFHQSTLVTKASNFDPSFTLRIQGLAQAFERAGASAADASHKALAVVYFQIQQQAATLSFIDALKMLAVVTGLMIPLLFFTQKSRPGAAPAGGH